MATYKRHRVYSVLWGLVALAIGLALAYMAEDQRYIVVVCLAISGIPAVHRIAVNDKIAKLKKEITKQQATMEEG